MMKPHRIRYFAAAALAGILLTGSLFGQGALPLAPAPGQRTGAPTPAGVLSKLSQDALAADPQQAAPVIVQFKTADPAQQEGAVAAVNGAVSKHFLATRAVSAHLSGTAMKQLANDPRVAYVSIDRPLHSKGGPAAQIESIATGPEFTVEPINAPEVWSQGYYGTGIGVAVIDSGISNDPDLNWAPGVAAPKGLPQRIVYSASFLPSTTPGGANDQYGHGTHVAGLIAGNGQQSLGNQYTRTFVGVAPNAMLINLRVLDKNGEGTDSSVIEAIEAAISLKNTYNIRVINLSLGRGIYESYQQDPLCQAVEAAWKAGIVVVVAAGNDGRDQNLNPEGYGTIEAPGNDPYVITVGAMNTVNTASISDDVMTSYSSKGPSYIDDIAKPDIVAPGNLVTSLLIGGSTLYQENPTFFTPQSFYVARGNSNPSNSYMPLSGTSMATGVASGAVALLLQAKPTLTPDQVKALMMLSAQRSYFPTVTTVIDPTSGDTFVEHYDALTVGAGYLDIKATLQNASNSAVTVPAGTAMSPVVTFDTTAGTATLVTDQTALWGRSSLWGASSVYGENAFTNVPSGTTALWGRSTLEGADDPTGFDALFGSTCLWGRSTPDATTALWGRSTTGASSTTSSSTALWGRSTTEASSTDSASAITDVD